MTKIFVLGAGGFVGGAVSKKLGHLHNVVPLKRQELDLTIQASYEGKDFEDAIIIDAIARIDGKSTELSYNNYECFVKFIDYLNSSFSNFFYVYLSTLSTLDEIVVDNNPYVNSKFLAEVYLRKNVKNYKVIRLSYPFGIGEGVNRLVSRLTNKILCGDPIVVSDTELYMTPISLLIDDIEKMLADERREINYLPLDPIKLPQLLDKINILANKSDNYTVEVKPAIASTVFEITRYNDNRGDYLDRELRQLVCEYAK